MTLYGQLTTRKGRRAKPRRLARVTQRVTAPGEVTVRLRPSAALRVLLRRERAVPASLAVTATDAVRQQGDPHQAALVPPLIFTSSSD